MRINRLGVIDVSLLLLAVALVGRAAQLQLVQGRAWAARAERTRRAPEYTRLQYGESMRCSRTVQPVLGACTKRPSPT